MKYIKLFLQEHYSDHSLLALKQAAENAELGQWNTNRCLLGRSDEGYLFHRPIGKKTVLNTVLAEREFIELETGWGFGKRPRQKLAQIMLPRHRGGNSAPGQPCVSEVHQEEEDVCV